MRVGGNVGSPVGVLLGFSDGDVVGGEVGVMLGS